MFMATKEKTKLKGRFYNYRGFAHMDASKRYCSNVESKGIPQDSLLSTLFAPDPATGLPSSSALIVVKNGAVDPATKEIIRRKYCSPLLSDSVGSDNLDDVLNYTKTKNETLNEFAGRLITDIENHYKPKKSKD